MSGSEKIDNDLSCQDSSCKILDRIEDALDLHYQQLQKDLLVIEALENDSSGVYKPLMKFQHDSEDYNILIHSEELDNIDFMQPELAAEFYTLLQELTLNPYPLDSREIKENYLRVNMQGIRIYYEVDESKKEIKIAKFIKPVSSNSENL